MATALSIELDFLSFFLSGVSMKENRARLVILDTNALLAQFQFGIDLEDELSRLLGAFEILIPSSVLFELKNVRDRHAKAALKLAERYKVIASDIKGDESILSLAVQLDTIVVTNDKALRKRLKAQGISVIFLRQKKYLAMDIP